MADMVNGRKSLMPYLYDEIEFYNHQIEGVRQLVKWQSFILADDMGLGKTLEAITVAAVDLKREWAKNILVISPATLKGNWQDEIEKFTTLPYTILGNETVPGKPGHPDKIRKLSPAKRMEQLASFDSQEGPKILVANYEQIVPHLDDLNKIGFDIIVYDEAHYIKNYKSKRTKACLKLNAARHFLLTGTPMMNTVNELWPLLHRIDPQQYPRYWPFVQRYCVFGGYEGREIVAVKNERELTERLKSVMLRRMKKDVLDLPDVQIIQRKVDLSPEQRAIYDKLVDEMVVKMHGESVTLEEALDGTEKPNEINALTKFLRMKQVCGTTLPFTGVDNSAKLDLAIEDALEILDTPKGEKPRKLVVFTQFRSVLEAFAERMDKAAPHVDIWELHGGVKTHDRQPTVKAWTESENPSVIVCMLQVAGVGLNMTAARHAFFLDKLFVPGLNQQAIDRLNRIGADSTQAIQIYEYLCRGTVETRIEDILRVKKKLFESIVEGGGGNEFRRKLIQALMEKEDD